MVELPPQQPMKTEDAARRLEYVLGGKWTPEQYKDVSSILRLYRHQAVIAVLHKAQESADDSVKG